MTNQPVVTLTRLLLLLVLPGFAAAQGAPPADEPCRVFVSSGEVRVFGTDGMRVVRTSTNVRIGESVESASATTVAFFRVGTRSDRMEGTPSKRLSCPPSALAGEAVTAKLARLMDHLMLQTTALSRPAGYRGPRPGLDGAESLRVLFPANDSLVVQTRPSLAWNLAGASFQVTLARADDQVVWRRTVAGTNSLPYPEAEKALDAGATYWWKVEALVAGAGSVPQQASASFAVATLDQRQRITRQANEVKGECERLNVRPADCAFAIAGVYVSADCWNDAVRSLLQAQHDAPNETSIAIVLGRMLALPPEKAER